MPGTFALDIYRGDSRRWQFKLWLDADSTQPMDLTGVTGKAEIRDKPSGKKITPLDCTITTPNIINVVLSADNSKALTIASGVWDLQLTYTGGDVATVVGGGVNVTYDVTDSTIGV
jgi:hypothetical protein